MLRPPLLCVLPAQPLWSPPEWTQRQVHSQVHRRRWRKRSAGGLSSRGHVDVRRAFTVAVDVEGGTGPSPLAYRITLVSGFIYLIAH